MKRSTLGDKRSLRNHAAKTGIIWRESIVNMGMMSRRLTQLPKRLTRCRTIQAIANCRWNCCGGQETLTERWRNWTRSANAYKRRAKLARHSRRASKCLKKAAHCLEKSRGLNPRLPLTMPIVLGTIFGCSVSVTLPGRTSVARQTCCKMLPANSRTNHY